MGHVVITTDPNREQTTIGAGGAATTSIGFEFFEDDGSDVTIYIDSTLAVISTDYTITPTAGTEGGYAGGTIVWTTTQTSVTVTAFLDIAFERSSDFPTAGAFNVTTLNTQLDKLWASFKQIDSRIDRSARLAEFDTVDDADDVLWPAQATRSSAYAGWDANGKMAALANTSADTAVSTFMATLLDDTTAAAGIATLFPKGTDVASATTMVIPTDGFYFDATGTTTCTGMTVAANRFFLLQADGAFILTHGASLELGGAANITTAAGDKFLFYAPATDTVELVGYSLASGKALVESVALNVSQAWTNQQYFTPVTDDTSTAGAVTFDFTAHGNYVEMTLTENLTAITLTGMNAGGVYKIRLKQHASAAKTITGWPAAVVWTDGDTDPVMHTTVSGYTIITIEAGTTQHCGSSENYL
jgi:hypothetical protein